MLYGPNGCVGDREWADSTQNSLRKIAKELEKMNSLNEKQFNAENNYNILNKISVLMIEDTQKNTFTINLTSNENGLILYQTKEYALSDSSSIIHILDEIFNWLKGENSNEKQRKI